jgi:pre-mRNA-processing factor 6
MDDAEGCLSRKPSSVHTSRAIYEVAVKAFSSKRTLWMAYAAMEKEYGSADSMQTVLQQAVQVRNIRNLRNIISLFLFEFYV